MKIHLLLSTKEALAVKVTYQLKLLKIWQLRLVMEVAAAAAVAALVMEVAVAVQQVAVAANNALQAESLFFYLID
jgi:hypothetical protein